MKTSHLLLPAVGALICGAMILSHSSAQAPAPAATTRVAVCDIVDVFNNYQRAKDLTAQLNERQKAIKAESEKRAKTIDSLRVEIEGLKPGSKEYEQRVNEMQRLAIERKAYLDYQEALALREHYNLTKEMYSELTDMVASIAKERGYDLVLQLDNEELNAPNTQELLRQIHGRKVLYAAGQIDLTATVLGRLNQAYGAKKTVPVPAPR